jgi:CubicO group peptidase (beta-lactamase class C family)
MELFSSPNFHHHIENLMEKNRVPGLSIAIIHGDNVKSIAFGLSSVQDQTPCTVDTLFDIASSSKSLTGVAIALLVDDEKFPQVQYDAIMSELLPDDFVLSDDSYTKIVTIDDLLGHRTGMPG